MTIIVDIYNKLLDCSRGFSGEFTTANIIDVFSKKYCQEWDSLEKRFGKGGKGSGRYYTSNVYIGQMLERFVKTKELRSKGFKKDAPKGWGNPEIAHYEQVRR